MCVCVCVCAQVFTYSSTHIHMYMYTGLGHERASKKCCYMILLCIQCHKSRTHTHKHTYTHSGIERRDRRVAASIQFQRGDAIIFKIGDKEMEGEIANLHVSPGCHLVRSYEEILKIHLFDNITFFPLHIIHSVTGLYVQEWWNVSAVSKFLLNSDDICLCNTCIGGKYQPKTLHSSSHTSTVVSLYCIEAHWTASFPTL